MVYANSNVASLFSHVRDKIPHTQADTLKCRVSESSAKLLALIEKNHDN